MEKQSEYKNFEHTLTELLKVPHSEIKAKLDAEKAAKKRKKAKQSSARRVIIELEGVDLNQIQTPEGRQQSEAIFSRNEDKLRKYVLKDGAQLHPRRRP